MDGARQGMGEFWSERVWGGEGGKALSLLGQIQKKLRSWSIPTNWQFNFIFIMVDASSKTDPTKVI